MQSLSMDHSEWAAGNRWHKWTIPLIVVLSMTPVIIFVWLKYVHSTLRVKVCHSNRHLQLITWCVS